MAKQRQRSARNQALKGLIRDALTKSEPMSYEEGYDFLYAILQDVVLQKSVKLTGGQHTVTGEDYVLPVVAEIFEAYGLTKSAPARKTSKKSPARKQPTAAKPKQPTAPSKAEVRQSAANISEADVKVIPEGMTRRKMAALQRQERKAAEQPETDFSSAFLHSIAQQS